MLPADCRLPILRHWMALRRADPRSGNHTNCLRLRNWSETSVSRIPYVQSGCNRTRRKILSGSPTDSLCSKWMQQNKKKNSVWVSRVVYFFPWYSSTEIVLWIFCFLTCALCFANIVFHLIALLIHPHVWSFSWNAGRCRPVVLNVCETAAR
jgi:hypothetical protein